MDHVHHIVVEIEHPLSLSLWLFPFNQTKITKPSICKTPQRKYDIQLCGSKDWLHQYQYIKTVLGNVKRQVYQVPCGWLWYWTELCPLCTLPWERPPEERDNQILWWHNKSHQLLEILSQWTWSCEKLDFSVIVWKFFKLTLVSVTCSTKRINKRL